MTNKQKALAKVAGILTVSIVTPLAVIALVNVLERNFTLSQILTGAGIGLALVTLVCMTKLVYDIELNKLETLDNIKGV